MSKLFLEKRQVDWLNWFDSFNWLSKEGRTEN